MSGEVVFTCVYCGDEFTCCDDCEADAEEGHPPLYCSGDCVILDGISDT